MGEYFSYIRIWGSNTVHLLLRIVPDRMLLQEIAYQIVIDGVFRKFASSKRNSWPKFPLNLEFLVLQNSTHASILGKAIVDMNLGEVPKRMHEPKSYLANHLV